ncbi:MAG: condensation domain-containing protein, partial [Myxococcota bacterium]
MSLPSLVDALARDGVRLWVEDGRVRFAGPTAALTPDRRQALADRRDELVALLSAADRPQTRYPATPWQLGLYLLEQQRAGGDDPYQEGVTVAVSDRVDLARLAPTATALALRHPILRGAFDWTPDGLALSIDAPIRPWVRVVEIADEAASTLGAALRTARPPALDPLFWIVVLRGPDRDLLHVGGHHLAVDAASLLALCPQAVALLRGAPPDAPQDMRYLRWLTELAVPATDPAWVDEVRAADPALALPRADVPTRTDLPVELGGPAFDRISAAARMLGCTRFQLVLAGWAAILHRFTGQEAVVIASPRTLRTDAALDGMVGYAVDTVPQVIAVQPSSTLRALAAQVRARSDLAATSPHRPLGDVVGRTEAVLAYQNLPGFKRLSATSRAGSTARPRFAGGPTGLIARVGVDSVDSVDSVELELVHVPAAAAKFPLELHLYELSDGIAGHLSLSGAFAPWLAARLVEALDRLAATLDATLDAPIDRHPALRAPPPAPRSATCAAP